MHKHKALTPCHHTDPAPDHYMKHRRKPLFNLRIRKVQRQEKKGLKIASSRPSQITQSHCTPSSFFQANSIKSPNRLNPPTSSRKSPLAHRYVVDGTWMGTHTWGAPAPSAAMQGRSSFWTRSSRSERLLCFPFSSSLFLLHVTSG